MGGRAALDEFIAVTAAYEKDTPGALPRLVLAYLRMADEREGTVSGAWGSRIHACKS